jgi:hypothetical protein
MAAVAHRLLAAAFAGAKSDLFGFVGFKFDRPERGRLVRAVAERLQPAIDFVVYMYYM